MSLLLQRLAALALGSSIAGALLAAFLAGRGVDASDAASQLLAQLRLQHAQPAADEHERMLRDDLASRELQAWEGRYASSNGYEHRTFLLSARGFFYEYSHCTGTGELAYGAIESISGARIRLKPALHLRPDEPRGVEPQRRTDFWFERELYVVPWDGERFLVTAERMPEFCALAKSDRWQSMRYADNPRVIGPGQPRNLSDVQLDGLPEVAPEFRHLLPH